MTTDTRRVARGSPVARIWTAVVLILATGPLMAGCGPTDQGRPQNEPEAIPTSAGPIEQTDWAEATIQIPENVTGCRPGTAVFHKGRASVDGTPYQMFTSWAKAPLYADFNHDDLTDAVIAVECVLKPKAANPPALLLVLSGTPEREQLGLLLSTKPRFPDGSAGQYAQGLELTGGPSVRFRNRTWKATTGCAEEYSWMGGSFAHRSVDANPNCQ